MPIKGMTDEIKGKYVRLGKLRKGAKKTQRNKPGKDLTYFRFTSEKPEIEAAFFEECGTEPMALDVYLPEATTEANFDTWMEEWNGSGTMLHRCNGEKCVTWHDDDGYHNAPEGEGPPCPGQCKQVGRLEVIIPGLIARGYIGTVTAETHSKHDILNISRALKKYENECRTRDTHGTGLMLRQMEFTLYREDREVSSPAWKKEEAGKRHKVVKSLLHIVPSQKWAEAQMLAAKAARLALPEPEPTTEEDPGEVVEGVIEEIPDEGLDWNKVLDRDPEDPGDQSTEEAPPDDDAPKFPEVWKYFAELAVEKLGYKHIGAVTARLAAAGINPIVHMDQTCAFDQADGWAILQDAKA